ncbi:MAG: DUF2283 domain-containing protein [Candidatus Hydrogenedentes bacterium]|nr:DUF2283 domain-containing protein [Candidatus Hydrogenedentota bacterium]
MQAKYFSDTDTLLLTFSDNDVEDSFDINEDVLVEVDDQGRVVSMTIEHAQRQTNVNAFTFERVAV